MQLKALIISIVLVAEFGQSHAQDKIYESDGDIIEAKVKSVGTKTITYLRFDNPAGPEYTILKKGVMKIKYENGTTDFFEADARRGRNSFGGETGKKSKYVKKYGDNIISIIPGAYTASIDGTINDAGLGLCYERMLDPRGHISFTLPVLVSFSSSRDFSNYGYSSQPVVYGSYNSYYIMPGVKFYPAAGDEKIRYSIGASFYVVLGSEPYSVYDNNYYYQPSSSTVVSGNWNYAVYGFMLSNSVNFSVTRHLFTAIDLGAGIPVSGNRYADNEEGNDGLFNPWVQIGIKLGYRF